MEEKSYTFEDAAEQYKKVAEMWTDIQKLLEDAIVKEKVASYLASEAEKEWKKVAELFEDSEDWCKKVTDSDKL